MIARYSVYEVTVPVFIHALENLNRLIEKAKGHCKSEKELARVLQMKLAADMYTFTQQVQYAYFMALETVVLLSGREMPPEFKYDEKTADDLQKNVMNVIHFLNSIESEEMDRHVDEGVKTFLDTEKTHPGDEYVLFLALPNFFFHVTTAYDILRHAGVPLRKEDYLGFSR